MTRESKAWLAAAATVAVAAIAIVLMFGISFPPDFPSLYAEGGPSIEGTVAYVDYGRDECVRVLDVASGESEEVFCDDWLWLEGWDDDGNLRVQSDDGHERTSIIDPETGRVIETGDFAGEPPPLTRGLRATSDDGHATLTYRQAETEVTLIDVEGPRDYDFWDFGLTADESYAWACDSERRLLVVALDGSEGPWVVAKDINEAAWK